MPQVELTTSTAWTWEGPANESPSRPTGAGSMTFSGRVVSAVETGPPGR